MQLRQLNIYGFGKWQDFELELPEGKLIIINGQNESGKSTLRQFCLFVLFGFPPKKREFFRPKTGGRMGGRIKIALNKGEEFVIERIHERDNGEAICYLSDGTTRGESWFRQQLEGIDLETFQSIFSFDAEDLSYLDTIKEEDLGDVLLGIGMAGTSKIYSIEKELENQLNRRFKPQGKNPEVNKQLNQLEILHKELENLQADEGSYKEKKRKEQELKNKIADIKIRLEELRMKEGKWERKLQALPLINQLQHDQVKKEQYADISHFPEDGLERYYKWKEKLLPLESEQGVVEANLEKYRRQLADIEQKLLPDQAVKTAEELSREAGAQNHRMEQLQKKQKIEDQLQQELSSELNQLQVGLEPDDLKDLILPFHLEEEWTRLKEEQSELESEIEKVTQERQTAEQQMQQLEKEKRELQSKTLPAETIAHLQQRIEEKNSYEQAVQAGRNHSAKESKWMEQQHNNKRISNLLLVISLAAGLAALLAAIIMESSFLYGAAVISLGGGIIQAAWTRQNARMMKTYFQGQHSSQAAADITDETKWQEAAATLEEQRLLAEEIRSTKERIQQLALLNLKLSERGSFYEQKKQLFERKINQHILEYPFLKHVDPAYWIKLYRILTSCKHLQSQLEEAGQEVKELEGSISAFKEKAAQFLRDSGYLKDKKEAADFDLITEILDQQKQLRNNSIQYEQWIERMKDQQQSLLQKVKPYQKEIGNLWALVPATDEASFLKAADRKKTSRHIDERMSTCYEKLTMFFPGQKIEDFLNTLPAEQWQLERELQEIKEEANGLENLLEQKRQELADVRSILVKMEQSESYSIMSHRFQLEKDHLRNQIRQWAIYQTAKQMLEETKRVYQQEYLPQAMEVTSGYFSKLTNGRYVRVFPPREGGNIIVESEEGLRFDVKELSKGSRDQLYVALRLALNEMMNDQHALPFFIDDGFVHFDASRTDKIMEILKQTAKNQQVLLFTCQPLSFSHFLPTEIQRIELA